MKKISSSPLYLKIFVWEYWPMWLSALPTVGFWFWFALRARHPFFFSAVNPSIETGGMMGESKFNILQQLPEERLPKTVFVKKGAGWETVAASLEEKGMSYPLVAKPNVGERGFRVVKAEHEEALQAYHRQNDFDYLIQEFVALPLEVSIFYHRFPGSENGAITSVCLKEFLTVTGDGAASVRELMKASPRASLQLERFEREQPDVLEQIPAPGEQVLLEPIGNHCRGTRFYSGNHLIGPELNEVFDRISEDMDGIHYGRFDMKCSSIDDLLQGNGFRILEYNGVAADPAHIYDPGIPVWEKYRDVYRHWEIMYRIFKAQREKGVPVMSFREARDAWNRYWTYMKAVK